MRSEPTAADVPGAERNRVLLPLRLPEELARGRRRAAEEGGDEMDPGMSIREELAQRDLLEMAERIAKAHQVTIDEMFSSFRGCAAIGHARHHLWTELYATGNWSYVRIGQLARRDHTTIIAGVKRCIMRQITRAA
jgi:hypothetical protein